MGQVGLTNANRILHDHSGTAMTRRLVIREKREDL